MWVSAENTFVKFRDGFRVAMLDVPSPNFQNTTIVSRAINYGDWSGRVVGYMRARAVRNAIGPRALLHS